MQPLNFTRVFNFEINTLQNHAHNLAMYLAWINILKYELSPNHCLTFLSHAHGYKSFAALNEAIKSNEVFEPLQSTKVYLERLKKQDYSNIFETNSVEFHDIILLYIVSYIVGSKLDLNSLSGDSPLKGIKLSAEKTSASWITTDNVSFINTAILNTIVASTFDSGLPDTFTVDSKILDIYNHDETYYRSLVNRNGNVLTLFNPNNITDLGYGKKIVRLSKETVSNFNEIIEKHNPIYSIDNISEPVFKVGNVFSKYKTERIIDFFDRKKPIDVITVEQNSYKIKQDQILEFIQTRLLDISLEKITQFEVDLNLSVIGFNGDNKSEFYYDLDQKQIRCHSTYIPFDITFADIVTWDKNQYTAEFDFQLNINMYYEIDYSPKPKIKIRSISLNPEKKIEGYLTVQNIQQDELDDCLFAMVTLNSAKKMPFENLFIKAINQHLNQFKFEIATYYTKSMQIQPDINVV